jgi:hypothetical protein
MIHGNSPFSTAGKVGIALIFAAAAAHADIVTVVTPGSALIAPFTSTASSTVTTPQSVTGDGFNNGIGPVSVSDVSGNGSGSYTFNRTIAASSSSFGTIAD